MHMAQIETWIRERAYALWEIEGRPDGREHHHWEQATRDVMSRGKGESPSAAPAKPAAKTTAAKGRAGKSRRAA